MRIAEAEMRADTLFREIQDRDRRDAERNAEREAEFRGLLDREREERRAGDIEAMSVRKALGRIRDAILRRLPVIGRRREEQGTGESASGK